MRTETLFRITTLTEGGVTGARRKHVFCGGDKEVLKFGICYVGLNIFCEGL